MAWMQVYQFVKDPPYLNPPADWHNKIIPSGRHFPHYSYEFFTNEPDWEGTGKPTKKVLVWGRASYWIPNQLFNIMLLQPDGTYKPIGTLQGPIVYHSLDARDGDGIVMYLQAV